MATAAQIEEALRMARSRGYKVTLNNNNRPQRTSLVESNRNQVHTSNGYNRYSNHRNQLQERMERYGSLAELASLETPLPEGFNTQQALRDFGLLMLYKDGMFD